MELVAGEKYNLISRWDHRVGVFSKFVQVDIGSFVEFSEIRSIMGRNGDTLRLWHVPIEFIDREVKIYPVLEV